MQPMTDLLRNMAGGLLKYARNRESIILTSLNTPAHALCPEAPLSG